MDEQSRHLIQEARMPLAAEPGKPAREDSAHEHNGTAKLLMWAEPLKRDTQQKGADWQFTAAKRY
jgi:hypothetical protein